MKGYKLLKINWLCFVLNLTLSELLAAGGKKARGLERRPRSAQSLKTAILKLQLGKQSSARPCLWAQAMASDECPRAPDCGAAWICGRSS